MYSINGVPLDNDPLGWVFLGSSEPLANVVKRVGGLQVAGKHGYVKLPSTMESPIIRFDVETPKANLESLYALFTQNIIRASLTSSPTREVELELMSTRSEGYGAADEAVQVEFYVRLNGVFWRDITETTTPAVAISTSPQTITAFPGISGEIQDVSIRIKGAFTGLQIVDSAGSWMTYNGSITASQYLLLMPWINRAVIGIIAGSWDDYTSDVSGAFDHGGAVGGFRLTPKMIVAPTNRAAELTITTATRSAATVQVRGKGAYIV